MCQIISSTPTTEAYNEQLRKTQVIINSYRELKPKQKSLMLQQWAQAVQGRHEQLVRLNSGKRFGHSGPVSDLENECDLTKLDIFLLADGYKPIFHALPYLESVYNFHKKTKELEVRTLTDTEWPKDFNGIKYGTVVTDITMCSFDQRFSVKAARVLRKLLDEVSLAEIERTEKDSR